MLFGIGDENTLSEKEKGYLGEPSTFLDHALDIVLQAPSLQTAKQQKTKSSGLEDIILLHIMAVNSGVFSGKQILAAFQEADLYFSDGQFHYYKNKEEGGASLFSVVSAIEPGFFEFSKMETFKTPGLTLFFYITRPTQSIAALEVMLRTAKQLSRRLEGEIKDGNRLPLTFHAIEKYREKVRRKQILTKN